MNRGDGQPVFAIADGTVVENGQPWGSANHNVVVVEHVDSNGERFLAVYGHLYSNVVAKGPIAKGAQIGRVQNAGTGPHLHFGIRAGAWAGATPPGSSASGVDGNGNCSFNPVGTVDPLSHLSVKSPGANQNPFGAYDDANSPAPGQIRVAGWAIDPSSPSTPLDIDVYANGAIIGSDRADLSRADVAAAYPEAGERHGYISTFNVPAGTFSVCVYAINIGSGTENPQLGCRDVTTSSGDPFGSFDDVTSPRPGKIQVQGWTVDPSDREAPTNVHIYVGGQAGSGARGYDIGEASISRADVAEAIPGAGPNHGFDKTLTAPAGTYPVCAYAINSGAGNNTELRCLNVSVLEPFTAPKPKISGTARVGKTLTAKPGSWAPAPVTLTYRWRANGKAISGATNQTLKLTRKQKSKKITVSVTGNKSGYPPTTKTSSSTKKVRK